MGVGEFEVKVGWMVRSSPLLGRGTEGLTGGVHHIARFGFVMLRLEAQKQAQLVLLLRQVWGSIYIFVTEHISEEDVTKGQVHQC